MSKFIFIISIFFVTSAFALECPSKYKVEDVAMDMIRAELSGIQLEEMENHECLSQKKFPHLLIVQDNSNELTRVVAGHVESMKDVKITKVETVDPTVHSYKVQFEVKYKKTKGGKSATISDSISFFLYKDAPNQSIYGCGGVLQHPEKILLLKNCKK